MTHIVRPLQAAMRSPMRALDAPFVPYARRLELAAIAAARRNNASLWYVRNDLSNVAQNTDGSGAMSLNAPIGLLLDQQYGGAMGSELVTNGGFDSGGSGWTPGAGWSVSSGAASMVSAQGSNTYTGQTISSTSGRLYRVQYDLTVNSGQAVVYVGSGGGGVTRNATGTYTEYIQAGTDGTLYLFGITGFTGSFDNVSVREVLEWSYALQFDGSNDNLTAQIGSSSTFTLITAGIPVSGVLGQKGLIGSSVGTNARNYLSLEGSTNLFSGAAGSATAAVLQSPDAVGNRSFVGSLVADGALAKLHLGGLQTAASAYTYGTGTGTSIALGAINYSPIANYFSGIKVLECVSPSAMPDADRQAIERFGAYLIGAPYAA